MDVLCLPRRQKKERQVHIMIEEFIEIVSNRRHFRRVAGSYLKDSGHEPSRAIYQYLKDNYNTCELIVDEMMIMFSSHSRCCDYYLHYYGDFYGVDPPDVWFFFDGKHSLFEKVHEHLWDDKDFVKQAVSERVTRPCNFQYASKRLRSIGEIVMEAVRKDYQALQFGSRRSRNNYKVVMEAVKKNGDALEYASKRLRKNRSIVMEALKANHSNPLKYASKRLKNNRSIVAEAVKTNGGALKYASKRLKNDRNIVIEAVKMNSNALKYASGLLKNDHNVVIEAVKNNGKALQYASGLLKNNRDIAIQAIKNDALAFQYVGQRLSNKHDFIMEAVKVNGNAVKYASHPWRHNFDVHMEIVKHHGLCWSLYGDLDGTHYGLPYGMYHGNPYYDLQAKRTYSRKKKLIVEAVKRFDDCSIIFRHGERVPNEDIAMEILKINPMTLRYLDDGLLLKKEFIMKYLELSSDVATVLDADNGTTALHCIFMALRRFVDLDDTPVMLSKDFGDAIHAYLQRPGGKEAAFMKDRDGMSPFEYLCRYKSLNEMHFLIDKSFSMLMIWWYEQIGIDLTAVHKK